MHRISHSYLFYFLNFFFLSVLDLETEYTDFEMESTNYGDKLGLKRKMKSKDDSTLRRPISQRKVSYLLFVCLLLDHSHY